MENMNPIIKNEVYKYSWLDKPPIVPPDVALVLYPHDSREHCSVYLQEDTVFPEAIKKWHLDRLAHISLQAFDFNHDFRFYFNKGVNQFVDITYKFTVSVKIDRDAVKVILKNNVTDISEPILEYLDTFTLDKEYTPLELPLLEYDALQKIRDVLSRLTYLKIKVKQEESFVDEISQKQIDVDKADKIFQADVEATRRKLERDKEEAEVRQKEVEIARKNAVKERELTEIRHQTEFEEQQHAIELKTREVAAQKAYQLQQAENAAAVAAAHYENMEKYGPENLAAIDSTYQDYINSWQNKINLDRENKFKNLELDRQKILLIKEMAEAGVIDDMMAGQMTQRLLMGDEQVSKSQYSHSSATEGKVNEEKIDISEEGKVDC